MAYFNDWFGRDADYGYTNYDPTKRTINWDSGYDNYSDFLFGKSKKSVNMEEAASLLFTMSKVVGMDRSQFTGNRNLSGKVHIPTDMLKDNSISTDIFLGACLQNIGRKVHQSADEYSADMKSENATSTASFAYKILNTERVNNLMSEDTPGYLKFVQKYKKHKYKERPAPDTTDKGKHLLDLFDRIIRYPENITEEELIKFKEPLDQIKKHITKAGGIPADKEECGKLSRKIGKILSTYIENPPEDEKDKDGDDDGDKEESEDTSTCGFGGGEASDIPPSDTDVPKETSKDRKKDLEKAMRSIAKSIDEDDNSDMEIYKEFIKTLDGVEDSCSSKITKVDYIVASSDSSATTTYQRILTSIDTGRASVIGTLLKRKNRDYQFSIKSMRSGRLDTNKLAEAKQHVSTIYERIGEVKTNKLSVTILIDESGSMCSDSKIRKAQEAAIFLNEALKKVPDVELFIYGHTADYTGFIEGKKCGGTGSTQLVIYKEDKFKDDYALGNVSARHENRDGTAMLAAAKRVRSKTQNQGVFIVISDGDPSADNYRNSNARSHVRKMANEVEKMGFQVIQVTIGEYESKDMFKHVINIDETKEFPDKFVAFLKTKINSLIKETIKM